MDAVKCWASTGMDALAIGPYLLEKRSLSVSDAEEAQENSVACQA